MKVLLKISHRHRFISPQKFFLINDYYHAEYNHYYCRLSELLLTEHDSTSCYMRRGKVINAFGIKGMIDDIPLMSTSAPDAFYKSVTEMHRNEEDQHIRNSIFRIKSNIILV